MACSNASRMAAPVPPVGQPCAPHNSTHLSNSWQRLRPLYPRAASDSCRADRAASSPDSARHCQKQEGNDPEEGRARERQPPRRRPDHERFGKGHACRDDVLDRADACIVVAGDRWNRTCGTGIAARIVSMVFARGTVAVAFARGTVAVAVV